MVKFYFGTSGWSYEEWVGIFYKHSEGKLRYYSSVFNTVEMDSSFYAFPNIKTIETLSRALPAGFKMSLKLPNIITHKRLLGKMGSIKEDLNRFLSILEPLRRRGKLGVILVQLPPGLSYDYELLKKFLMNLDYDFNYAIEFRHLSWLKDDIFNLLRDFNVAYTIVDEPLLPPITVITSDFTYIRWHGKGSRPWYNYWYKEEELKPWIPKIKELSDKVDVIYGYFNNHFRAYAVENCLKLMLMLGLLDERRKRILEEVGKNIISPKVTVKFQKVEPKDVEGKSVLELLLMLSNEDRVRRGVKISRDEVSIIAMEKTIEAKIKDYILTIDPEEKILMHDCADWNRVAPQKMLCKHFIRLFTLLPEDKAKEILKDILLDRDSWSFRLYTEQ